MGKFFTLIARAGAAGERQTAAQAILRLITTHLKTGIPQCTFVFPDYGSFRLCQTDCKDTASKLTVTKTRDIPLRIAAPPLIVEDAIDKNFNGLFDQRQKLTDEILSEPTELYEIGESVLLGTAIPSLFKSIQSNEEI